jgi:hypothetical protein
MQRKNYCTIDACVIECVFGKKFTTVYPAVKNYDSYFFTNNPEIKHVVESAGWRYLFVNFPLSDDDAISSLQSKYIKFLQFLKQDEYSFFRNYNTIIYTDHKLELKNKHIKYLLKKLNNYDILVRDHPDNRKNIWEEVGMAMFQERYLRFMPQTIDYIRRKIQEGYSEKPTVITTGLIVYKHLNNNKIIDFTDMVYNYLTEIGTSECQIIWSMVGQKYTDIIKIIKWDELDIKWQAPVNKLKKLIKYFMPYGMLQLWYTIRKARIRGERLTQ